MRSTSDVAIVIPCYNEAEHIGDIVKKCFFYADSVIVADDNSQDDTAKIAAEQGAFVTHRSGNFVRGVGNNTWCGIYRAMLTGADIFVILDGDGQHDTEDIPKLVDAVRKGADVALGSRFLSDIGQMPSANRWANRILTGLCNFRAEVKVTDSQSGMRAFYRGVFKDIRTVEAGFSSVVETTIKARKAGLNIVECPIRCIYLKDAVNPTTRNEVIRGMKLALGTIKWRIWEGFR